MAKSAIILLNTDGTVARTHSPDIGGGIPTTTANDLENLLQSGYLAKRETVLSDGKILVVLEKP